MSQSIPDKILEVIAARLAATSGTSGVKRPTREGENIDVKDKQILLSHDAESEVPELSCAGNPFAIAYLLPVRVTCLVIPSLRDDVTPVDKYMNDFVAAAKNAVTLSGVAAAGTWHTMEGNCINATMGPAEPYYPPDDTARGMSFVVGCVYRVFETDHLQLAQGN